MWEKHIAAISIHFFNLVSFLVLRILQIIMADSNHKLLIRISGSVTEAINGLGFGFNVIPYPQNFPGDTSTLQGRTVSD